MLKISEMHPSWVRHNGTVNLITKDTINSGKNSINNSNNSFVHITRDKNNVLLIKIVKIRISINFQKCVQDIYIYIYLLELWKFADLEESHLT